MWVAPSVLAHYRQHRGLVGIKTCKLLCLATCQPHASSAPQPKGDSQAEAVALEEVHPGGLVRAMALPPGHLLLWMQAEGAAAHSAVSE